MKKTSQFIAEFRGNTFDELVSKQMQDLVNAVTSQKKKGKLTINIEITPKNNGELLTKCDFKVSIPSRNTVESIMFASPGGDLLASDPAQPSMFERIEVVKNDKPIFKTISA